MREKLMKVFEQQFDASSALKSFRRELNNLVEKYAFTRVEDFLEYVENCEEYNEDFDRALDLRDIIGDLENIIP